MTRAITIAIALLVAAPAGADVLEGRIARSIASFQRHQVLPDAELQRLERERVEHERVERERLNLATAIYLGTAGADWSVTAACFRVRCSDEPGHAAGFFVGGRGFQNAGTAAVFGLALDALVVVGVRQWVAPKHPKLARSALYVLSGVRLVIVTGKVSDLRTHAQRML